jgi:hypothetical protein
MVTQIPHILELAGAGLSTIGSLLLGRMALLRKHTIEEEIEIIATIGSASAIEGAAAALERIMRESSAKGTPSELDLPWETEEGQRELKEAISEDMKKIENSLEQFRESLLQERHRTIWSLSLLALGFLLLLITRIVWP